LYGRRKSHSLVTPRAKCAVARDVASGGVRTVISDCDEASNGEEWNAVTTWSKGDAWHLRVAAPTKIEAYNDFLDRVSFGGPAIKSGDPVEQEKQLKYASLVANAIMLSNVADMTAALAAMAKDGQPVTPSLVACLSPYIREHIRRFGQYVLDMSDQPSPLNPQPLPFKLAL
jgi:hypothetical protein